jgi:2,5-diamino-6-(ribosylamino)-4(3H)-pyrimidinone 5'-phosphate reductase
MGRRPWIICVNQLGTTDHSEGETTMTERKKALEDAGARIIEIPPSSVQDSDSHLSLPVILKSLNDLGIRSLMVEGGARIIGSFCAAPENIIDALIITVAPILVGSDGVGYQCVLDLSDSKKQEVHTELIGRDTVVALVYNDG